MTRFPIFDPDTLPSSSRSGASDLTQAVYDFYTEYADVEGHIVGDNLLDVDHSNRALNIAKLCWAYQIFASGNAIKHLNAEFNEVAVAQLISELATELDIPDLSIIAAQYLEFIRPLKKLFEEFEDPDEGIVPYEERIELNFLQTRLLIGTDAEIEKYLANLDPLTSEKLSDWLALEPTNDANSVAEIKQDIVNKIRPGYGDFAPSEVYSLLQKTKAEQRLHWVHLKLAVLLIEEDLFELVPHPSWKESVLAFAKQNPVTMKEGLGTPKYLLEKSGTGSWFNRLSAKFRN